MRIRHGIGDAIPLAAIFEGFENSVGRRTVMVAIFYRCGIMRLFYYHHG